MYEVSENYSCVSMSMLKVSTIKLGILGHTDEDENPKSSRDVCKTRSKDSNISSEDKDTSSKCCSKVSTVMSNYDE